MESERDLLRGEKKDVSTDVSFIKIHRNRDVRPGLMKFYENRFMIKVKPSIAVSNVRNN